MRKGRDGEKKWKKKKWKKIMTFIVATNVVASWLSERRPTGTPHAHAKRGPLTHTSLDGNVGIILLFPFSRCKSPSLTCLIHQVISLSLSFNHQFDILKNLTSEFLWKHPKLFCLYLSNQISLWGHFVIETNRRLSSYIKTIAVAFLWAE